MHRVSGCPADAEVPPSYRNDLPPVAAGAVVGPQQAGGDTAPWGPFSGNLAQLPFARPFVQTKSQLYRPLQGHVAGRENIGMAATKQQEHLCRPRTHALDRDHPGERIVGRQPVKCGKVEAVVAGIGDLAQRADLGSRQTAILKGRIVSGRDCRGTERRDFGPQALPDRRGGGSGDLLGHDYRRQAFEVAGAQSERNGFGHLMHVKQPRIIDHEPGKCLIDVGIAGDPRRHREAALPLNAEAGPGAGNVRPPVVGFAIPVVPGKVMGSPRSERAAR